MTEPITDDQLKDLKASLEANLPLRAVYASFITRVEMDALYIKYLEGAVADCMDGVSANDLGRLTGLAWGRCLEIKALSDGIFDEEQSL